MPPSMNTKEMAYPTLGRFGGNANVLLLLPLQFLLTNPLKRIFGELLWTFGHICPRTAGGPPTNGPPRAPLRRNISVTPLGTESR